MIHVFVDGNEVDMRGLTIDDALNNRSVARFSVIDRTGIMTATKGTQVEIYNESDMIYKGFVDSSSAANYGQGRQLDIVCMDMHWLADKRSVGVKSYQNHTAGYIVKDIVSTILTNEGVKDNDLTFTENTKAEWDAGTVDPTLNTADNAITLKQKGTDVNSVFTSTADFDSGTKSNIDSSSNQIQLAKVGSGFNKNYTLASPDFNSGTMSPASSLVYTGDHITLAKSGSDYSNGYNTTAAFNGGTYTSTTGASNQLAFTQTAGWSASCGNYGYRKTVPVTGGDTSQTNYSVKLTLYRVGSSDSTGNVYLNSHSATWTSTAGTLKDIRFTNASGTLLDHYIESDNGTTAVVWVELDTINTGGATIYAYYGYASDAGNSNATNTFMLFDLANTNSFNASVWNKIQPGSSTINAQNNEYELTGGGSPNRPHLKSVGTFGRNLMFQAKIKHTNSSSCMGGISICWDGTTSGGTGWMNNAYTVVYDNSGGTNRLTTQRVAGSNGTNIGTYTQVTSDTNFHTLQLAIDGSGNIRTWWDGTLMGSATDTTYTGTNYYLGAWARETTVTTEDFTNFVARKWTLTEPVIGVANSEVSQFPTAGNWVSDGPSIAGVGNAVSSSISWTPVANGGTVVVQASVDGSNYYPQTSGQPIVINGTNINNGYSCAGKTMRIKVLFTGTGTATPTCTNISYSVASRYVLTGTWTGPADSIAGVVTARSSTIVWTPTTPSNTSLTVQTSIDGGSSWQTIASSGSAITGIGLGYACAGKTVQLKITLNTTDGLNTPTIDDINPAVTTAYYTSAQWVSPVVNLNSAAVFDSTSVSRTVGSSPANTSIAGTYTVDKGSSWKGWGIGDPLQFYYYDRPSVAWGKVGNQVTTGTPRFDGFGPLMVEGTTNLVSNPSATTNLTNWNCNMYTSDGAIARVTNDGVSGQTCVEHSCSYITPGGWSVLEYWFYNDMPAPYFDTARIYTVSFYAKGISGNYGNMVVGICGGNSANNVLPFTTLPLTTGWQRYSFTFVPIQAGAFPELYIYGTAPYDYRVTDVQLEIKDHATPFLVGSRTNQYQYTGLTIEEPTVNLLGTSTIGVYNNFTGNGITTTTTVLSETVYGQPVYRFTYQATTDQCTADMQTVDCNHGCYTSSSLTWAANTNYTASILWRSTKADVRVDGNAANLPYGFSNDKTIKLDNGWNLSTVLYNGGGGTDCKYWSFWSPSYNKNEVITIDFVAPKVEQLDHYTSYIAPGTTRQLERYWLPYKGIMNMPEGTFEIVVNVTQDHVNGLISEVMRWDATVPWEYQLLRISFGGVQYTMYNGTTNGSISVGCPSVGPHRFAIRWSATEMALFIDGVKQDSKTSAPFTNTEGCFHIGSSNANIYELNTQVNDLVVSNIARDDSTLASRGVLTPLGVDSSTTCYCPLTSSLVPTITGTNFDAQVAINFTSDGSATPIINDVSLIAASQYQPSGIRVSPDYSLGGVGLVSSSSISWGATTTAGNSITVETSIDEGLTWQTCTNGGAVPGLAVGTNARGNLRLRQTLNTTNHSTPTLTSTSVILGTGAVFDGVLLEQVSFGYDVTCDRALTLLAERCGYWWCISSDGTLYFCPMTAIANEVGTLTNVDMFNSTVKFVEQNDKYRNKQIIRGGTDVTSVQNQTLKPDGTTRSWTLAYPLNDAPVVKVNTVTKTVGLKGIDTGKDFYYQVGDSVLAQDFAGNLLQTTDTLTVQYYGQFPIVAISQDDEEIARMAALAGQGTGIVEASVDAPNLNTSSAALQYANNLLDTYSAIGTTISFTTQNDQLYAGSTVFIDLPNQGIDNMQMLITKVSTFTDGNTVKFSVEATDKKAIDDWVKLFIAATSTTLTINEGTGSNNIVTSSQTYSDSQAWTDSFSQAAATIPLCSPSSAPNNDQFPG